MKHCHIMFFISCESYLFGLVHDQAVYVTLREAEMRSTSPIPTWEIPIWKDISPRQRKVNEALVLINNILDELIATCKVNIFLHFDLCYYCILHR
jgi:hypothetical protein